MKYLKKLITGLTLLSSTASATPFVSAELTPMNEKSVLDFKFGGDISDNIGFFSRSIVGINYKKEISYFSLIDLVFPLRNGFDLLLEAQLIQGSEPEVVPRIGLQYFKELKEDVNLFALYTMALNGKLNGEFVFSGNYTPKLNNKLNYVLNLENVTNFGDQGHNFSVQRIRTGLKHGNIEFGPALNLSEDPAFSYNAGGFVRVGLK